MTKWAVPLILTLLLAAAWATHGGGGNRPIRVGAAASLAHVLAERAAEHEARTGQPVRLVFASSGRIAAQLRAGAGYDAVVLASPALADGLAADGHVDPATRRDLARNTLVVVAPIGGKVRELVDLADPARCARLALGEPGTVPAGRYARQALETLDLWDELAGRAVYAASVRQALSYAAGGEVDAAVVYATDARQAGPAVRVVAALPADAHDPIAYPAAVATGTEHPARAAAFLDDLSSPAGRAALARHGFRAGPP